MIVTTKNPHKLQAGNEVDIGGIKYRVLRTIDDWRFEIAP